MALPQFDMEKFYRVRATGSELQQMFATLERLDVYAATHRRRKRWALFIGFMLVLALHIATCSVNGDVGAYAFVYSFVGLLFVSMTWLVPAIVRPNPDGMQRPMAITLSILCGVTLVFALGVAMDDHNGYLAARDMKLLVCACSVGSVSWLLLWSSGTRWPAIASQRVEVDYVKAILSALFNDLPKKTRGDVVFNPYHGEWSHVLIPVRERPGYRYKGTADIILQLRLPLDDEHELRLSVVEQAVAKTKIRKGKYKGTKRRLIVRYVLTAPAGSPATQASVEKLLPGSRVTLDKGKLTVLQIKQTKTFDENLKQEHLLPAADVLDTIRLMSLAVTPSTPA